MRLLHFIQKKLYPNSNLLAPIGSEMPKWLHIFFLKLGDFLRIGADKWCECKWTRGGLFIFAKCQTFEYKMDKFLKNTCQ